MTFYLNSCQAKLVGIPSNGIVVSNAYCEVMAHRIDLDRINAQLEVQPLKSQSPIFRDLLGGNNANVTGFSVGLEPKMIYEEDGYVFIGELRRAFALDWSCDAKEALDRKARDIYGKLRDAIKQFEDGQAAIVHIGMETLDGSAVEKMRFEKILNTVSNMDVKSKRLEWKYVHFMESGSSINEPWYMDESVTFFKHEGASIQPLKVKTLFQ